MNAFEQLRDTETGEPIAPNAVFAARLRARVTEALVTIDAEVPIVQLPDRTQIMTTPDFAQTASAAATTTVSVTLVPYLSVSDAAAAIDWYVTVLGAVEMMRYVGDDGRVGHAEISVGGAKLMLADEYPEYGIIGPATLGGTSVGLNLNVDDVDSVWARAIEHGAQGERPPADEAYGERSCTFRDPSGHRWSVQTTVAIPTPEEITEAMGGSFTVIASAPPSPTPEPSSTAPVELGYVTLGFTDTAMASRFYRELFGWRTEQGHSGAEYAHVNNTALPLGFTPDGVDSPPALYFRVDDAEAYAARVRDLGGTVVSEATYDSGGSVVCRDDQGREFLLWQPAPGY